MSWLISKNAVLSWLKLYSFSNMLKILFKQNFSAIVNKKRDIPNERHYCNHCECMKKTHLMQNSLLEKMINLFLHSQSRRKNNKKFSYDFFTRFSYKNKFLFYNYKKISFSSTHGDPNDDVECDADDIISTNFFLFFKYWRKLSQNFLLP